MNKTARVKDNSTHCGQQRTVGHEPKSLILILDLYVGPAWVLEQTLERRRRELEAKDREDAERLAQARKKEAEMKKKSRAHVRKKQVCEPLSPYQPF